MDDFNGKIAIVTGGASGIGRALCEALARSGAVAIVADLDLDHAREVAAALAGATGRLEAAEVDVTRVESVQALVDGVVARHGRLDFMFNNAGIAVAGEIRDIELEHWRRVIDVNLWGVIYGSRAAYTLMLRQGYGHIVNLASGFGLTPGPANAPYVATKYGVVGFTETLRIEAEDLGVRASVVCPGYVQTAILTKSPCVRARLADVLAKAPFPAISPDVAAQHILRGVARNDAIIAFPRYVRVLTFLYHVFPRLIRRVLLKAIRDFRSVRQEEPQQVT
jgi:NAD(P)-dependent dehydrogenase (short-subunit alcohol dehydrogenase family)